MGTSPEIISSAPAEYSNRLITRRQLFKGLATAVSGVGLTTVAISAITVPRLSPEGKRLQQAQQRVDQRMATIQGDLDIATNPELHNTLAREQVLWEQQRQEITEKLTSEEAMIQPAIDQHTAVIIAGGIVTIVSGLASTIKD